MREAETNINVDMQQQVVIVEQMSNQFALKPDTVRIPFNALKVLVANILLAEQGALPSQVAGVDVANTAPRLT